MTLEEPSRLRDRDVLRSCLYQSQKKKKEKKSVYLQYRLMGNFGKWKGFLFMEEILFL